MKKNALIILCLVTFQLTLSADQHLKEPSGPGVVPGNTLNKIDTMLFSQESEPPLFSTQKEFESFEDIAFETSIYHLDPSEEISFHDALMREDREIANVDPKEFTVKENVLDDDED
jgi:hypothetical protein